MQSPKSDTSKIALNKVAKTRSQNAFKNNVGAPFNTKQSKNSILKYGVSQTPMSSEKRQRSKRKNISSPLDIQSDGNATFNVGKLVNELKINTESKLITARDTEVAEMATNSSVVDPLMVGPAEIGPNVGARRRSLESARVVV
jgi:hypothetical protein